MQLNLSVPFGRTLNSRELLDGLLALTAGSPHGEGLKLLVANLEIVGPREFVRMAAKSLVAGTPVVAPLAMRVAAFARRAKSSSETLAA
jgi:hypothetical protein